MSNSDLVLLEDRGAYAMLRINRAEKRNAMSSEARRALSQRLKELHGVHKVVVITGSGASFCSGVDLKESAAAPTPEARAAGSREWIDVLLEIRRHPAIFIAAVNGYALGGGTSLINVCDLAIAADEAQIGMPEMGFGAYPAMAGPSTQLMISPKRAAYLVLTTNRLDGKTAESWGLVNRSVPLARLDEEADKFARHVAQFDTTALSESKRALETVPHHISDWPGVFDYGQTVSQTIRAKSGATKEALARFARGEANPGQGEGIVKAPLAGVTVIETASDDCNMALRLSAALAGRIAADLGAEVVKIEPPDGDPVRRMPPFADSASVLFAFLNAGKRSVVLPHGREREALHALLGRADVVVADAKAGEPLKDVVGSALPAGKPRAAILLSMLGRNAPPDVPASEFTVMALGGVLNLVGEPDRQPLRLGGHQVAYAAGLSAFTGLVSALCGTAADVVHVSLLENAVWLNWKNVATAEGGGEVPSRAGRGSDWPIVRCKDGWVALVYRDDDWPVMRELMDNDPRLADPALGKLNARHARAVEIASIVEEHIAALTRAQLRQLCLERKLPLGPVLTPAEALEDPQHLAREFFATVQLGSRQSVTVPRLPVLWSGEAFLPGAVPALGSGVAGAAS